MDVSQMSKVRKELKEHKKLSIVAIAISSFGLLVAIAAILIAAL